MEWVKALALVAPIVLPGSSVDTQVSAARTLARCEGQVRRATDAHNAQLISSWAAAANGAAFEAVRGITTLTSHMRSTLGLSPEAVVDFDFSCPSLSRSARLLASMSAHNSRHQQFLQRADSEWDHQHAVLTHAAADVVPPAPRASPCLMAGFCVCSPGGKKVIEIRNSWHKSCLVPVNPEGPLGMPLLLEGFLVVRLDAFATDAGEDDAPHESRWLHIGLHYKSPKRCCFMALAFIENQDNRCVLQAPQVHSALVGPGIALRRS